MYIKLSSSNSYHQGLINQREHLVSPAAEPGTVDSFARQMPTLHNVWVTILMYVKTVFLFLLFLLPYSSLEKTFEKQTTYYVHCMARPGGSVPCLYQCGTTSSRR